MDLARSIEQKALELGLAGLGIAGAGVLVRA